MEKIRLNLIPSGTMPTCHASQYDEGRVIRIELFEGVNPYTLSASESVSLGVRKPDQKIVTMPIVNTQANYVDIVTTLQTCAVTGSNLCELTISDNNKTISTLNFIMQVERSPLMDGDESESQINDLQERVNECVEVALEDLYDGTSVAFDTEPVESHDEPYTVTSAGIFNALAGKASASEFNNYYTKSEVDATFNALNASNIGYDGTNAGLQADDVQEAIDELAGKSTNVSVDAIVTQGEHIADITIDGITTGLYSTEAGAQDLDDLDDVTITNPHNYDGLYYDNANNVFVNGKNYVELTQSEYNTLVANNQVNPDIFYYITDSSSFILSINELTDVVITNAQEGDVLAYDSNNNWVNKSTAREDVTSQVTFSETVTGTNTKIFLKDDVLYIYYQGENKAHANDDTLFTLPASLRPSQIVYMPFLSVYGSNFITGTASISADGACKINQINDTTNTGRVYFAFAYPLK